MLGPTLPLWLIHMYIDRRTTANVILWLAAAGDAETRFPAGQLENPPKSDKIRGQIALIHNFIQCYQHFGRG